MVVWISAQCRPAMVVLAAALVVPGVQGAEYKIGEGKLSLTGSTYLGTALRTDEQDRKLRAEQEWRRWRSRTSARARMGVPWDQ